MSLRHTMTKFRSFLQNALVEYIGVYSDTNKICAYIERESESSRQVKVHFIPVGVVGERLCPFNSLVRISETSIDRGLPGVFIVH